MRTTTILALILATAASARPYHVRIDTDRTTVLEVRQGWHGPKPAGADWITVTDKRPRDITVEVGGVHRLKIVDGEIPQTSWVDNPDFDPGDPTSAPTIQQTTMVPGKVWQVDPVADAKVQALRADPS